MLVGPADENLHAHTGLRRRALERLGCRVSAFDPQGRGGWVSRLRRAGLQDRLARAIASAAPAAVVVLEDCHLEPELVDWIKRGSGATWAGWFCDTCRPPDKVRSLASAYDLVFVADSAHKTYHARVVMLGAANFDYTEVVNGLKEGEHVALLTSLTLQAQRQQQADRIRQGMGVPGLTPNAGGGRPGGGGGGNPRGGR